MCVSQARIARDAGIKDVWSLDMSEFQPYNLNQAWDLLSTYIEQKRRNAPSRLQKYPEAFETWGLITQLYDAYKANTVHSEPYKQIAKILSRTPMPHTFAGVYNDEGYKILLQDLLVYINKELEMSLSIEPHAEQGKEKRAKTGVLDAGDIERIQKWPHCCTIIENFMQTIVEPAWKDMEELTHVEKWRDKVYYSKDPQSNIKEEPLNPIDYFEYWASVLMWGVYPETMENLYNEISYTPNNPSVPSPGGSSTPDWTFAVYVLRWMVIHDPTVSEENRDAYKTVPLSLELIDKIERLYSETAPDANEFLGEGGLGSLLARLKQLNAQIV